MPGPSHIDAEFHAFQAGPSLGGPLNHPIDFATPPQLPNAPNVSLPSWATDFQNQNIHSAPPPIAHLPFRQSPFQQGPSVNWHHEFIQQRNAISTTQTTTPQGQYRGAIWQPPQQSFGNYNGVQNLLASPQVGVQHATPAGGLFDDAAFERAFEAISQDMAESESKGKEAVIQTMESKFDMNHACVDPGDVLGDYDFDTSPMVMQDPATYYTERLAELQNSVQSTVARNLSAVQSPSTLQADQRPKIGSDLIASARDEESIGPEGETDELAKTAGQLLDNLKNEQSQKFRKSNFLELMRQLRDKEVRVEDDKMVQVGSLHRDIRITRSDEIMETEGNLGLFKNFWH